MGRQTTDQRQLSYAFNLEVVVPADHLVREIAAVLDLSWVHEELAPHYSHTGRPSIDPLLIIRMLILGYVFAIRSERALCREVQVNLATVGSGAWGWRTRSQIIRHSRAPATSAFQMATSSTAFSSALLRHALQPALSARRASRFMQA